MACNISRPTTARRQPPPTASSPHPPTPQPLHTCTHLSSSLATAPSSRSKISSSSGLSPSNRPGRGRYCEKACSVVWFSVQVGRVITCTRACTVRWGWLVGGGK